MKNKLLRTHIELDSQALNHNIDQLKNIIGQNQKLAVVVKSNAYGHGIKEIAQILETNNNVDWLCTAGTNEALFLRKHGIKKNIVAISYIDSDYQEIILNNVDCAIYNYQDAYDINQVALKLNKIAKIHIKIDTGMSRLGILPKDAINFIKSIQQLKNINIFGVFSHFCDTSNPDLSYNYLQMERFDNLLDELKKENINIPCTHIQSSSSLSIKTKRDHSFIRAGAFVYGLIKSEEHKQLVLTNYPNLDLKPVLTWKTKIVQIKKIPTITPIGYNRSFITQKETLIGILPIGYSDGFSRSNSNKAFVLINDQLAPIIGIVSMNLCSVDITDIKNLKDEQEVILIGNTPLITAQKYAQYSNTITNELMAQINAQIPRIIK